jgi:hypothetical protein
VTSDVLPFASVDVAVMYGRALGAAKGIAKVTCPAVSVVSFSDPS